MVMVRSETPFRTNMERNIRRNTLTSGVGMTAKLKSYMLMASNYKVNNAGGRPHLV